MSKNSKINERLNSIQQKKEQFAHNGDKGELVTKIMNQEEEKVDMKAIAEALQEQREEQPGLNVGYRKDTLYIQEDIYNAFNALCVNRGDKKKFVNEAIQDFVLKKYKELGKKS